MVNLTQLLANLQAPTGLWPTIFDFFASWVPNYGWTIVLFTIAVKLLVSPLDFYNRYSTRKNNLIQKRLSGQVQKINQKHQNNKDEANRQVSALYKKEGYNMIGSCVFMLINMVVTMVVFFSFFNSLRTISSYKMLNQYDILQQTYTQTYNETGSIETAEAKTLEAYLEFEDKNSWLWIKNVWRNDSKTNPIPSYNDLKTVANNSGKDEHKLFVENISEEDYNKVVKSIQSENTSWNGYYILAVLVIITTLLSQWLTEKLNDTKKSNEIQNNPTQPTMKMMKYILPVIMLIFVVTNTASFGIYILVGNILGIIINLLFGIIVKKLTQNEENKYLNYLEREALKHKNNVKTEQKPRMVTYKQLGDKL